MARNTQKFWTGFNNNVQEIEQYKITDIIPQIETLLSNFLFPAQNSETDHKLCTLCKVGKLSLKLSKYGAFLACDNYPSCNFTRNIAAAFENNDNLPKGKNNKAIGYSDDMQKTIYLKEGLLVGIFKQEKIVLIKMISQKECQYL
ncbi:topoisomerase DNA binding C4 zinc finger family protein [Orientia tsutsugamushi str. Sido]|nr:topoisomerase DNA binding C4 zinc finger family protein [Orientia tsutsugamushi str. Sido]